MDVGTRLRIERERLALNQSDMGQIAGVSRNSQTAYETGKTPFTSEYLRLVAAAGVDTQFVITGARSSGGLEDDQAGLISSLDRMSWADRAAFLRVADALSGVPISERRLHLPPTHHLTVMFKALLAGIDPALDADEQALLLAQRLPIGLAQLQHVQTDQPTPAPETTGAGPARPRLVPSR